VPKGNDVSKTSIAQEEQKGSKAHTFPHEAFGQYLLPLSAPRRAYLRTHPTTVKIRVAKKNSRAR
jgi:hypothetical protein